MQNKHYLFFGVPISGEGVKQVGTKPQHLQENFLWLPKKVDQNEKYINGRKEIVKVVGKLKPWNICTSAAAMMCANYLKYFFPFEYLEIFVIFLIP